MAIITTVFARVSGRAIIMCKIIISAFLAVLGMPIDMYDVWREKAEGFACAQA